MPADKSVSVAFQASFNCLWCGRPHQTRGADDIEGFALLCPDCVGRAQDNEFLRYRLREGLKARAAASQPTAGKDSELRTDHEYDDWYLRRGRHSHGTIADVQFQAELDQATLWLDSLPLNGEIVELAAGTGWWSPLLAQKGELWIYDAAEEPLERARERLLAHGLRAHIHVRDAWAEPDRKVDALFTGLWISQVPRDRLDDFLALARRWLRPGGIYAFIDERPDAVDTPTALLNPTAHFTPAELEGALQAAGFATAVVTTTGRFLVLGRAG